MALVFGLQVDAKRSHSGQLRLRSSPRRFSVGFALLLGGALLGTMYAAASPLFDVLLSEGGIFDQFLSYLIISLIILYPAAAILCWFYGESVVFSKAPGNLPDEKLSVEIKRGLPFWAWTSISLERFGFEDFRVHNWMGAVNMASLEKGKQDRYATKGHWILSIAPFGYVVERRAKREEIEALLAEIANFFQIGTSKNNATQHTQNV